MSSATEPKLIVCVDDEEEILGLVKLRLTRAGYAVRAAADGDAGLALVRELKPALALLDVRMPGIDGYELTRMIRDDSALAEVRVMLLSASVHKEEVKTGIEAGADEHLKKPFRAVDLLAAVAKVIGDP